MTFLLVGVTLVGLEPGITNGGKESALDNDFSSSVSLISKLPNRLLGAINML